jgi:hypothetical protein
MIVAMNFNDREMKVYLDVPSLNRIMKKNRLKPPVRFSDENGNYVKIDDLAKGFPLQPHSSMVFKF